MSKPATTVAAVQGSNADSKSHSDKGSRYFQLMLLVLAAGAIYPILYLRQVYQTTMLEVFQINHSELGYLYSMLGTIFLLSYLPSGWLADRIAPRFLIFFSLVATGALGLWYSTAPSMTGLMIIFGCWGLTTGLTFWASVLKRVKMIAHHTEQGRFFGILDGGRGLVEALLATVALGLFAFATETRGESAAEGFKHVVYLYAFTCIAIGCVLVLIKDPKSMEDTAAVEKGKYNLLSDLTTLVKIPELWLVTAIVFCGYHIFWATYSFSDYLQGGGMTAVMAGTITTIKLWMRPIGGIGGGWLGDKFSNISVLIVALFLATSGDGRPDRVPGAQQHGPADRHGDLHRPDDLRHSRFVLGDPRHLQHSAAHHRPGHRHRLGGRLPAGCLYSLDQRLPHRAFPRCLWLQAVFRLHRFRRPARDPRGPDLARSNQS